MDPLQGRTRPLPLRTSAVLIAVLLALAACGGADSADSTDAVSETAPAPTTPAEQFTGTIGGDPALEGGCLWLQTDGERYELQLPDGFDVDREALAISGPGELELGDGDEVTVVGDVVDDMMTVCQVGPVLDVADISPAG